MSRQTRIALGFMLALLLAFLLAAPAALGERPFELRLLTLLFLYALLAHGWNILGGYAGQTSIGHGLFFGVGAYVSTLLGIKLGVNPWLGMVAGGLAAAALGVLISIPCFRLRGHYFVIATLVVAESAQQLFTGWDWVGGAMGLQVPLAKEGLWQFQFHRDKTGYYYIALVMLGLVTAAIWLMQRSRFGIILRAIRDDEEAASSLGFSTVRYKLVAMALSAGLVGVCGVFYAQYVLYIDPASVLSLALSVLMALIVILGGAGTVAGPIVGAAILVPLSEYSRVMFSGSGRNVDLLIYGMMIMIIAVFRPEGLMSLFRSLSIGTLPVRPGGVQRAPPAGRGGRSIESPLEEDAAVTCLEFKFERGGTLRAKLIDKAARTIACVRHDLPLSKTVFQARWSGREIFVPVQLTEKPPRECQSIRAGIGDVIYFFEWADGYDQTGFEAIGMFYGNEIVREWRGESAVNVFAHIDESQWDLMREIGERVWRRGGESIEIRIIDDGAA